VRRFPPGFLWGTATAAHQVEGNNTNNDWWLLEQEPGRIRNGDSSRVACDHYKRFREDFRMLRELNQNAHRISIEWSRIEPQPGQFDAGEIRHYRDVLAEMREQGLVPMVTLHHFTSPIWFAERGGWAAAGAAEAFLPYVRKVADQLGELVGLWCTINEPSIYATHGWLLGEFPPARRGDILGMRRVLANFRQAHDAAYEVLKQRNPDTPVGLAHNKFIFFPANRRSPLDLAAARIAQSAIDTWPLGLGRFQRIVKARCDYIGVNHYYGQLAAFDPFRPQDQFIRRFNPPGLPVGEFDDYVIQPQWLKEVLLELKPRRKPIYVTENGIAASDDSRRQEFLKAVLTHVHEAIELGVDVRGYFHWTSMDNFEWAKGYSMKFGLIDVNRRTMERTAKPSAHLYARIARANALPPDH
jgi:beta-glucosidase